MAALKTPLQGFTDIFCNQVAFPCSQSGKHCSDLESLTVKDPHRFTEWIGLEGTSRIRKLQPPCCRQGHKIYLHPNLLERNLDIMFGYYDKEEVQSYLEQCPIVH